MAPWSEKVKSFPDVNSRNCKKLVGERPSLVHEVTLADATGCVIGRSLPSDPVVDVDHTAHLPFESGVLSGMITHSAIVDAVVAVEPRLQGRERRLSVMDRQMGDVGAGVCWSVELDSRSIHAKPVEVVSRMGANNHVQAEARNFHKPAASNLELGTSEEKTQRVDGGGVLREDLFLSRQS